MSVKIKDPGMQPESLSEIGYSVIAPQQPQPHPGSFEFVFMALLLL
jgi:hypothetical protein